MQHTSFYRRTDDGWFSTPLTRGPWDEHAQHGGPPAALVTRAFERAGERAGEFIVARVAFEILRPVPLDLLHVHCEPIKLGRTVERWQATLSCRGTPVLEARALRVLARPGPLSPEQPFTPWPQPNEASELKLRFFRWEVGYHQAVELRVAGGTWGSTPIRVWGRPRVPLVADEPTTPLQALMILADAQSGMGVPLDPLKATFINPDLTVYLERPPVGEWFGFDIRSTASGQGMGLAQSEVRDGQGVVARSAQSLVIVARS